jgi:hypothetical protein
MVGQPGSLEFPAAPNKGGRGVFEVARSRGAGAG